MSRHETVQKVISKLNSSSLERPLKGMGRIIAIDYGAKRCGMAWTDPLQISINPLETIGPDHLEVKLESLISTGEVSDVVFGLPSHADGNLTKVGVKVKKLKTRLQKQYPNQDWHFIDEAYSSQRAKHLMVSLGTRKKKRRQKESVDQMSAVIILKDFLDRL